MMKLKVKKAKVLVEFDFTLGGSVLKGTVNSNWKGVATRLEIDSDEPMEKIVTLVKNAKGGCFAERLVCCGRANFDHLCRLNFDQGLLLT